MMVLEDTVTKGLVTQGLTADLLQTLIRRPVLVKILRIIRKEGGAVYTRRLLALSGSYLNHRRITELAALKLIRRVPGMANGRLAIWNELTPLGRRVLDLLDALDVIPADLLTATVTNGLVTQGQSAEVSQPRPWEDESIPAKWRLLLRLLHGPATTKELVSISPEYRARISEFRKRDGLTIEFSDGQYLLRSISEARELLKRRGYL